VSILDDEDDFEEKTVSLDDLEPDQDKGEDDSDWGDEYDDMDSESWGRQYGDSDEVLEGDPWDLS